MSEKTAEKDSYKLIRTTAGTVRVSQACDRCRIKKIKCDGLVPCHNCSKINFDCVTSDKLTRRAFPKGYTENLEHKLKECEEEIRMLKAKYQLGAADSATAQPAALVTTSVTEVGPTKPEPVTNPKLPPTPTRHDRITLTNTTNVQVNNPIDQIFNLDSKGIIIGNDNLNFESQFNHLLINLNLPFLKITNLHNFLLNDPNLYLYHPSYTKYNRFHNRDLDVLYNPLTASNSQHDDLLGGMVTLTNNQLPIDIYDFFIKLINNFKKIFSTKRELDNLIVQFFLNYNVFIPTFDYKLFIESYDAFHTMYPFMFTYDDATINGFNISNNDYHVVNEFLMVVVQIYAMIMMNDPTINLNLLLNHLEPKYINNNKKTTSVIRSLYDFLPYFNVFHVSVSQLQTYLLFLHYSLITNNKEKSLILASLINSFIGILGINLNSKNLFFNDLTLTLHQRRTRVKIFWVFKILLKVFNLKFGFKPSLNTTVINPVTIDRYFELTPEKLSSLLDDGQNDEMFQVMLKPSIEFLNLVNIIIPSSFSPNYYQYLKGDNDKDHHHQHKTSKKSSRLDWILNDDDGDGNDGNLNYNSTQFSIIDKNLTAWRETLKDKELNLIPLQMHMNLPVLSGVQKNNLYHHIPRNTVSEPSGLDKPDLEPLISPHAMQSYLLTGLPDTYTASQLIKIQLNFHYLLIRSMNYLNFIIDKELTSNYYHNISEISREVLSYFILIFGHVGESQPIWEDALTALKLAVPNNAVMESLGLDVDEDGFVINDFLVKRRRTSQTGGYHSKLGGAGAGGGGSGSPKASKNLSYELPRSPFNHMLNAFSMTVINLKKSIILQMLYLLICSLKIFKKGKEQIPSDFRFILVSSVDLFIKCFINYNPEIKMMKTKANVSKMKTNEKKYLSSSKELKLFRKLINDELKDEILKEPRRNGTDDSDGELSEDFESNDGNDISHIDWDDEDMDEDLKYLKILKFIKYKIVNIYAISKKKEVRANRAAQKVNGGGFGDATPVNSLYPIRPEHNSMLQTSNFNNRNANISKLPALTKFDFMMGENNFPMHTSGESISTPNYATLNKPKGYDGENGYQVPEDIDMMRKERLAINDLMSLKNQHKGAASPMYHNNWTYEDEVKQSKTS